MVALGQEAGVRADFVMIVGHHHRSFDDCAQPMGEPREPCRRGQDQLFAQSAAASLLQFEQACVSGQQPAIAGNTGMDRIDHRAAPHTGDSR